MNLNINMHSSDDETDDKDDGNIKKHVLSNQLEQFNQRSDKENLLNLSINDIETLDSLLNIPAPLTPIFQNDEDFIINKSNLKVPQLKSQSQSEQQFCNLPMINVEPPNNNNNNNNNNSNRNRNHNLSQFNFSQIEDFNSVSMSSSSVNVNSNSNSNSNSDSNINNFLLTPFSGEQFNQHRDISSLSDISSANSPYYSASESIYEDDNIVNDIVNADPTDNLNLSRFDIQGLTLNEDPFLNNLPQQLLTERNLLNLHQNKTNDNSPDINIIIDDPEKEAAKTPSLFSQNSSRRSSMNQDKPEIKIEDTTSNPDSNNLSVDGEITSPTFNFNIDSSNSQNFDPSKKSNDISVNRTNLNASSSFLNLPNMNDDTTQDQMRIGRQRRLSQSRSSSRSGSRSISRSVSRSNSASASVSGSRSSSMSRSPSIYSENEDESNDEKKYVCEICLKDFTRPYNLKSHLRTHTNERPYICKICGKSFARQHDRKRHEDLHTGEKKFQCKGLLQSGECWGCGKKFARTDALRRHFQTESGKECIRKCVEETLTSNQDYDADGVAIAMKNAQAYKKSEQKKQ